MIRPLSRTALVLDVVGAIVVFAMLMPISLVLYAPGAMSTRVPETVAIAALVGAAILQCGALAIGRLAPGIALAVAWVGALVQMAAGLSPLPINVAILGVLYATAAWGSKRILWAGLASAGLGAIIAGFYITFADSVASLATAHSLGVLALLIFSSVLALGTAWLAGFLWRMVLRSRRIRQAQAHAEMQTVEEQERVRIARDMHDVVAHSLAVVIAQADGARYAAATDPDAATAALGTISQTARGALSDVRMLLTQLRHRQGDGPQPTLADLEALFAQVRQSGIEPQVTVDPMPPGEPPMATQLAVYRILQEALTNVIRHGAGGEVDVQLAWQTDYVQIRVSNAIDAARVGVGGGHGIIGMRERAQLAGGVLRAERDGERFVVRARLPIGAVRGEPDVVSPDAVVSQGAEIDSEPTTAERNGS
ncbi:histidine kinase [Microbacterium sp. CH12i]|uniref:sensor histidine kinase n=1 Tax=Microbacterium sp. CH12i TaxID=1479651 RepID=UPI00046130EA|nr:histidine kinase [Microbacterium sp. CH12i]KDA04941.1 histidine kinase [Microbacterium sp. CH12i]